VHILTEGQMNLATFDFRKAPAVRPTLAGGSH